MFAHLDKLWDQCWILMTPDVCRRLGAVTLLRLSSQSNGITPRPLVGMYETTTTTKNVASSIHVNTSSSPN